MVCILNNVLAKTMSSAEIQLQLFLAVLKYCRNAIQSTCDFVTVPWKRRKQ